MFLRHHYYIEEDLEINAAVTNMGPDSSGQQENLFVQQNIYAHTFQPQYTDFL